MSCVQDPVELATLRGNVVVVELETVGVTVLVLAAVPAGRRWRWP